MEGLKMPSGRRKIFFDVAKLIYVKIKHDMSSTDLRKPPPQELKVDIIAAYWRKKDRSRIRLENYGTFFDNYWSTCCGLFVGFDKEAEVLSIKTHEEIIQIVNIICDLVGTNVGNDPPSCLRPAIRSRLPNGNVTDPDVISQLNNSINLVLRLWLHVEVQDDRFLRATRTIMWNDDSELTEFMRDQFEAPTLTDKGDSWNAILDARFKAVNLNRYCGTNFHWTSNLLEHLHFDKEQRIITIFSMKECLQDQINWYDAILNARTN